MLVKCRICKNKIDRDNAFKIKKGSANYYYCNEQEYEKVNFESKARLDVLSISHDILGYIIANTSLNKEMSIICAAYPPSLIRDFLKEKEDKIETILRNKNFNNEYSKIRYFSAIIKNKIEDYRKSVKPSYEKSIDVEIVRVSRKRLKTKKCIDEYLEGYDG